MLNTPSFELRCRRAELSLEAPELYLGQRGGHVLTLEGSQNSPPTPLEAQGKPLNAINQILRDMAK